MKDLMLLLKFSYKNKARPKRNRKGQIVRPSVASILLGYFLVPVIFIVAIVPTMIFSLKSVDLNIPLSQLGMNFNCTLLDLLLAPAFLMSSALFILQFAPLIITSLYDNDMITLLLSMPIKRSTIFFSASIDSFIMSGMAGSAVFSMIILYLVTEGANIFFAILSAIGFLLFLFSISLLVGLIMSFFVGKTSAKRLSQLMYFIVIILIVLVPQILPQKMSSNPEDILEMFGNSIKIFMSPIWPHTQFMQSSRGNVFSLIFIYVISVLVFYLIYKFSSNLDFSTSRKKSKVNKIEKFKTSRQPLLKKEIKLLFRNSQLIFMMLYPLIFPIFFSFAGINNLSYLAMLFMIIAANYTSLITSMMLAEEIKIWPVPKLFPYSTKTMVNSKVLVSSSIFSIEFLAISLVYFFIFGFNIFELILIIPTIILLYYSSLIGARYFLSDPHRDVSQTNKVFKGKEILIIESITMGYAVAIFGLLLFYDIMVKEGLMWIFKEMGMFLTSLIILGTVTALVLIIIFSIRKEIKKIDRYIEQME
ncbi:MAG TPA: hypothetical protein PK894_00785 [Defluviitoga sp.]|nr:hypothetical protein [Defluviitoga sp.]HOP24176.1 hypothetical protein [Defluviitoga sp.]HPT77249.1 hypothetical protein [Defluviitaleaceae bacterium]HPZ28232.1 hypothetical protein [Defluviitoga sp.]HQD62122.1 hypothetical protein [Defluviitoga sp.]